MAFKPRFASALQGLDGQEVGDSKNGINLLRMPPTEKGRLTQYCSSNLSTIVVDRRRSRPLAERASCVNVARA